VVRREAARLRCRGDRYCGEYVDGEKVRGSNELRRQIWIVRHDAREIRGARRVHGFAAFTQEVVLNPESPSAKVDAELILASRQQEQSNNSNAAIAAAGRGFQSLAMDSALSALAGGTSGFGGAAGNAGGRATAIFQVCP